MSTTMVPAFGYYLLRSCCYITKKLIQEKYEGCKLMMNSQESRQYSLPLSINQTFF